MLNCFESISLIMQLLLALSIILTTSLESLAIDIFRKQVLCQLDHSFQPTNCSVWLHVLEVLDGHKVEGDGWNGIVLVARNDFRLAGEVQLVVVECAVLLVGHFNHRLAEQIDLE